MKKRILSSLLAASMMMTESPLTAQALEAADGAEESSAGAAAVMTTESADEATAQPTEVEHVPAAEIQEIAQPRESSGGVVEVDNTDDLNAAVINEDVKTIKIVECFDVNSSLTLNRELTIVGESDAKITYTGAAGTNLFTITTNEQVTIRNLNGEATKGRLMALSTQSPHVTLENSTFYVKERGISFIQDGIATDAVLTLDNTKIHCTATVQNDNYDENTATGDYRGISIYDVQDSTITLQNNSELSGFGYCINVTGVGGGRDIVDTSGLVIMIEDSLLRGWTGFNIWGSFARYNIVDSTVLGINNLNTDYNSFSAIVFNGDIYNQFDGMHAHANELYIEDSTIKNYQENQGAALITEETLLRIDNGITKLTFAGKVIFEDTTGKLETALDLDSMDEDKIPAFIQSIIYEEGATITCNSPDSSLTLAPTLVAQVGENCYLSLSDALTAAKDGDTVKLLVDAAQDITLDRPITIDGQNQYTITGSTKLYNGTLKDLTLTTTNSFLLTIGSAAKNTIRMEGVTVKYPVTGTTAETVSVAGGNNADIVITGCTFMNEPNNNGVTENAPEWSYGLYMNNQGAGGSFTFENSRFDGAFRTMLANINGAVSITGSTFVNSIYSNNSGSASGSGEEATCITTANADVSGISITGNTFDNAGAFYFQKTAGAKAADNTFRFDRFAHFIQVRGGAAHPLDLSDNTFEMGNNDLVSIDVAVAPIIYPADQKAVNYWAWADTPADSRPADYSSYVYAYNADGSKTFYPESSAALEAFLNPKPGNIGAAAGDTVTLHHNLTLIANAAIPANAVLILGDGAALTIPEGMALTNHGTIINPDRIKGMVISGEGAVSKSSVVFEVYPAHASIVVVNAQGETVSPVREGLYYLQDGNYTYQVSAEGYSDKSQSFVVDRTAKTISVTLKKISSGGAYHPEAGSTSSASSDRYEISKPSNVENGSIKVSDSKAEKGDTVTITVTPDEGYELDKLAVYDEDGDEIDLEDEGDGEYTFEMPEGDVEIEVSFAAIEDEAPKADFADVAADAWYADVVQYVYENGMMSGTSETTFSPNLTTTRGMIVTILYRLEGSPDLSDENLGYPYADVDANAYYADAVYWARQNGIVAGMSAEQFAPNNAITREQMAAILYRYAQFKGYDVSATADLSVYTDAATVGAYATDAMAWANGAELITGTSAPALSPAGQATRAQVATILMRFFENIAK